MTTPIAGQRGVALVTSMVFLTVLIILGVSAMNTTVLEERMAGNQADHFKSFQAAESVLRDAELDLLANVSRTTVFTEEGIGGYWLFASSGPEAWHRADWSRTSVTSRTYGSYTGSPAIIGVAEQPRYIIEDIPDPTEPRAGESAADPWKKGPPPGSKYYRITARGTGSTPVSQTMLQAIVKK